MLVSFWTKSSRIFGFDVWRKSNHCPGLQKSRTCSDSSHIKGTAVKCSFGILSFQFSLQQFMASERVANENGYSTHFCSSSELPAVFSFCNFSTKRTWWLTETTSRGQWVSHVTEFSAYNLTLIFAMKSRGRLTGTEIKDAAERSFSDSRQSRFNIKSLVFSSF